ncbi:MAG: M48 family metalloprotease [Bacteroidota bacterium]
MLRFRETLIILLAAMVLFAGCATDKIWVGAHIVTNDDDTEVETGREQHKRILEEIGAYNDLAVSQHVEAIGEKIAAASDRPKLHWHFTVLDSAIPNAFATQGGYVYITRGMLALLQSDDELAAILSHESAHICARDTLHQQRVGNIMGIGMLGVLIAAPELLLFPQVAAAPAGAGMAAISRKDELKADRLGTEYLRRAGYPPETMQTTMTLLENMETYEHDRQVAAGQKPSTWWHRVYASHPAAETRQKNLTETTSTQKSAVQAAPQTAFLALLDGVEFGSPKFEGIPFGNKRYFRQMNIVLEVPEGWFAQINKARNELWLARPDWKARMVVERTTTINAERPCETLAGQTIPSPVTETKAVRDNQQPSCTGLVHKPVSTLFRHGEQIFRAGVIADNKASGYGYIFRGYADAKSFAENDPIFLAVARSVEPVSSIGGPPKPLAIHIRRALPGETFASLARSSRIPGRNAESLLRLLNRRYPAGEPAAGELIKVIE